MTSARVEILLIISLRTDTNSVEMKAADVNNNSRHVVSRMITVSLRLMEKSRNFGINHSPPAARLSQF